MNFKLCNFVCILGISISCPIYAKYTSYVGDLIARDLDFPGASYVGHVGIVTANYYKMKPDTVLEGMASAPHIQSNTIADFKSRSTYWGSKGGLLTPQSIESYHVANRIVRQYYACPSYSYTWQWEAGEIRDDTSPIKCAIFRCDTLVNYGYAFNDGYSLPTYNKIWTTPLAIYNYFPIETDSLVPLNRYDLKSINSHENDTLNDINEENISMLEPDNFYQILQNSEQVSKDKLNYLWSLFKNNLVNEQVKILFYNFILFHKPNYLTQEIIEQSKKEKGLSRNRLLLILQNIYQEDLKNSNTANLNLIKNYFIKLQSEQLNKDDAGIIYRGVATLSPNNLQHKNNNLMNMDKIHIDIALIKKNPSKQKVYIAEIIECLKYPDDNLVVTATFQYLTLLLIQSELKIFSQESKKLLKTYLSTMKVIDNTQSMLYTSAYIEFKASLNAKSTQEIPKLIYQYMDKLDEEMKEIIPYGFSEFTKKALNYGPL